MLTNRTSTNRTTTNNRVARPDVNLLLSESLVRNCLILGAWLSRPPKKTGLFEFAPRLALIVVF